MESGSYDKSESQKRFVLCDILKGLVEIHQRGLVHGDIKPGNILITGRSKRKADVSGSGTLEDSEADKPKYKAVIGDLGFVSLAKYSKVRRTAAAYRDIKPKEDPAHDMLSLGVVMVELFGNCRANGQMGYGELKNFANRNLRNNDEMRKICLRLFKKKHRKRPSSDQILKEIFGMTIEDALRGDSLSISTLPDISSGLGKEESDEVEKYMQEYGSKHTINRIYRGFAAVKAFIAIKEIDKKKFKFTCCCMLMILSSLFGKSGFDERRISQYCSGYSHHDITRTIMSMIDCREVLLLIMLPTSAKAK